MDKVYCKNCFYCIKVSDDVFIGCGMKKRNEIRNEYTNEIIQQASYHDISNNRNGDCVYYRRGYDK